MALKERYIAHVEGQLQGWRKKLARLAVHRSPELRALAEISSIRCQAISDRLSDLKAVRDCHWGMLRERVELAWHDLTGTVNWRSIERSAGRTQSGLRRHPPEALADARQDKGPAAR